MSSLLILVFSLQTCSPLRRLEYEARSSASTSVTRLADLSHFGQLLKASGNNYFAQIAHILGNFIIGVKIFLSLVKSFLGNFFWSRWLLLELDQTDRITMNVKIDESLSVGD